MKILIGRVFIVHGEISFVVRPSSSPRPILLTRSTTGLIILFGEFFVTCMVLRMEVLHQRTP